MLVVNRYENRQTGKVTIQAHVIKGKKLIKSYAPCCQSLIDMIAQNYSFYMLCDVDYYSKLSTVKIVNAWKWICKGIHVMKSLNTMIRQVKQQIIDNLDDEFNPIDLQLDQMLESKLCALYKQRKQEQFNKIDSLSNMYLRLYAWKA